MSPLSVVLIIGALLALVGLGVLYQQGLLFKDGWPNYKPDPVPEPEPEPPSFPPIPDDPAPPAEPDPDPVPPVQPPGTGDPDTKPVESGDIGDVLDDDGNPL